MENYTEFAYERFKKKRIYIWKDIQNFIEKKLNLKIKRF